MEVTKIVLRLPTLKLTSILYIFLWVHNNNDNNDTSKVSSVQRKCIISEYA